MSILFIFIQLISIIIFLKLKKTDKKENIVLWSTLSIITLMCFNILVTLIFNMIKIKSTLLNLLGGMDKVTSGEIKVGSEIISKYNDKNLTKYIIN